MKTNRKAYSCAATDTSRFAGIAILLTLSFTVSIAFVASNSMAQSRRKPARSSPVQVKPRPSEPQLRDFEFDTVTVNSKGAISSRRKGHARYYTEDINGVPLEMVEIPGGSFTMGASGSNPTNDERPAHRVNVPSFYMGKYEVTQALWRAVAKLPKVNVDLNPDPSYFKGDNLPVEMVSSERAMEFCARLFKATGRIYRLPSEAEWEYACRAGTTTEFAFGETITPELANYDGNDPYGSAPQGMLRKRTVPVGSLGVANGFGLYDMHGNVDEWCLDFYHGYFHDGYEGAPTDGSAWPGTSPDQILRGGNWRSAQRVAALPVAVTLSRACSTTTSGFESQQPGVPMLLDHSKRTPRLAFQADRRGMTSSSNISGQSRKETTGELTT